LLFYIIRALAKGKGQPYSTFPPVPLEVRMSATKAAGSIPAPVYITNEEQNY